MNISPLCNGVVAIKRPEWATDEDLCTVMSACTLDFDGRRAIGSDTKVPFGLVRHLFDAFDDDVAYAFAELKGTHLEFYEKASQLEFFITAGGEHKMYPSGDRRTVY